MKRLQWRQIVILLTTIICIVYLFYRTFYTLNLSTGYASFASIFLLLGEAFGVTCVLLFFVQIWNTYEPPQKPVLEGRTVDVFVPTYNEDPAILRATIEACNRMDYPHKTYVLDDGKRESIKELAAELGVAYITRPDNRHAKAGNMNHAFEKTDGEFIIIFDADHVPEPHFITRLIGYFEDEKLAFVQTPHAFYNFDSFQARHDHDKREYWEEGHLFYNVIQPGRNHWDCPIFAGAAAMFRRKALEEVGYIATETITEDMHTGLRMHAKGWKSLGISERMIVGQAAPDITTFHTQRLRWGEGNLSIIAYDNPATTPGLTLPQRLCYLGSMIHWAGGLFKLPIYLTPIMMMFTGIPPVNQFTWFLAVLTVTYLIAAIFGVRYASKGHISLINAELFCMVNFWTQIRGTMRALFWRKFQKFVVTSKRGRQSKSIWPFIRPHVFLAGLSVLGLVWGWGRVVLGISEDYFKPIIPTVWIVFHMILIWMSIKRAMRPEDQRYSYRHTLNLPAQYEFIGVEQQEGPLVRQVPELKAEQLSGYGLNVDLSEGGAGLILYTRLPQNSIIRLKIWGRGELLDIEAKVRWVRALARVDNEETPQGYRYGVEIRDIQPSQVDIINRITLHYSVPRWFAEYDSHHDVSFRKRMVSAWRRWFRPKRFAERVQYSMPIIITPENGPSIYTVTEDVSRNALSAMLAEHLPKGSHARFRIPTPMGDITGTAKLVRDEKRTYAAKDFQLAVFEMDHFDEQGRVTFDSIIVGEHGHLIPAIKPQHRPHPVPMMRSLFLFLITLIPLSVLTLGFFRWFYSDEFFLRDLLVQKTPITSAQISRVDEIYQDTLEIKYPSTDRLSLLMRTLTELKRTDQLAVIAQKIAPRDRGNLDVQLALAQSLDNTGEHQAAEAEYQRLLEEAQKESLSPEQRQKLLLGAARSSVHAGNLPRAIERLSQIQNDDPDNLALRNELAGVLISDGKLDRAERLLNEVTPNLEGRLLLVAIHTRRNDLDAAEDEVRRIIALDPEDIQAKQLLADVLSWKKGFAQSRQIYEQLLRVKGATPELALRLAQVALWSKQYDDALARYQALWDQGVQSIDVMKGYVDAASSATHLSNKQKETARTLYDKIFTSNSNDAILFARLAWVMQRADEHEKSAALLNRAVVMQPDDPELKKQLFGALVLAGRYEEALGGTDPENMDLKTREYLIGLHVKNKNFAAAASECRRILQEKPGDLRIEKLLANVLSWGKRYKESLELFRQLAVRDPNDDEIPLRIAEVTLWSGDQKAAVDLFEQLLQIDFNNLPAQQGFIDAVAAVDTMSEDHANLALRIYEYSAVNNPELATFYTRLSWVLLRDGYTIQADRLLDQIVKLQIEDSTLRKELAGVLAAAKKNELALKYYEGTALTVQDRFALANIHASVKNYKSAIEQCELLLKNRPNDTRVRRLIADIYSWDGQYDLSLKTINQLLMEMPQDAKLQIRRAEVTLWSKDYDKALSHYRDLLQVQPARKDLWPDYINAASSAKALTGADAVLVKAIIESQETSELTDVEQLMRRASVALRLEMDKPANMLLDRALAMNPKDATVRKELAGILGSAQRYKESLQLYQGLQLALEDYYALASLYASDQQYGQAMKQCRILLTATPKERKPRQLLADLLSWDKQYTESLKEFDKLLVEYPQDKELKRRRAEVTLWSGDQVQALRLLTRMLDGQFEQPEVWPGYVAAAAGVEKLTKSQQVIIDKIEKQVGETSEDAALLARLAWIYQAQDDNSTATRLLKRALSLELKDAIIIKEMIGILAAVGLSKEALVLYQRLPEDRKDPNQLAELYVSAHDFDAAIKEYRALLQKNPNDRKLREKLADIYSWARRYDESLTIFRALIRENPNDITLKLREAEVTQWSGENDKALTLFARLLGEKLDQPRACNGFVAAASGVETLSSEHKQLIEKIYDKVKIQPDVEVGLLAQLAWVFQRTGNQQRAEALLDRALRLKDDNPQSKRQLARVLSATKQYDKALAIYNTLTLSLQDREELIGICSAAQQFDQAIEHCQAILKERPNDVTVQLQLADNLSWDQKHTDALKLYQQILKNRPNDNKLIHRIAQVTLWNKEYDKSLSLFRTLLNMERTNTELWADYFNAAASATTFTDSDRDIIKFILESEQSKKLDQPDQLIRRAWVALRVNMNAPANALLDRVLTQKPKEADVVKELAGVLGAAHRFKEGLECYKGVDLTIEDRYALANLYVGDEQFTEALKQCRIVLAARPKEKKARQLLADILSWNKEYNESLEILTQLVNEFPKDKVFQRRQAEVLLWSGEQAKALWLISNILTNDINQPELWPTMVSAAAGVRMLLPEQLKVIDQISNQVEKLNNDPVTLARLAWIHHREKQENKAKTLLDKALALEPNEPVARRELSSILAGVGRYQEALQMFEGVTPTLEDRYELVSLYSSIKKYKSAIAECRQILKAKPNDERAQRLLADVFSWDEQYKESLTIFTELLQKNPKNLELQQRQAEVVQWSGDPEQALVLFQKLLEEKFDRPSLWDGYIAAAAAVTELKPAQQAFVLRIYDKVAEASNDVPLLARLAWIFYREKNEKHTDKLLKRALALKPTEPVVKRELAGVLSATKRFKEAVKIYEDIPLELSDRYKLVGLYSTVNEFKAATQQCELILKEVPNDPKGLRLYADVLSWDKQYQSSLDVFSKLLRKSPNDRELLIRQAQVTLWFEKYNQALRYFEDLFQTKFELKLAIEYVDAAASADEFTSITPAVALQIASQTNEIKDATATFFSRLAWVMIRLEQKEQAERLLTRAVALLPKNPAVRKEVAGVLAAVGNWKVALEIYDGLQLTIDEQLNVIRVLSGQEQFKRAKEELLAILATKPDHKESRLLLLDILSWSKDYSAALKLLSELSKQYPNDPELTVRSANLALWSEQYDSAVTQFGNLLVNNLNENKLWAPFIDAAASAKKLNAKYEPIVLHIYEKAIKTSKEDVFLSRLGWVLRRYKHNKRSIEVLTKAMELNSKSREARKQLAEALYEQGEFAEAEKHFKILLRSVEDE